ncbi:MAG TPA: glycosyltransferase family 1 protein [Gammaproteobacteria bacterium]|nr:glycosyltransferase family 1 protein [Gammaproteobacteria bacterium]
MATSAPDLLVSAPLSPPRLRIVVVTETYPPEVNGVALTVGRMVAGLRERGHEVSVVRPRRDDGAADPATQWVPGLPVPFYPEVRLGLPAPRALQRLLQPRPPDAMYVATEGLLGRSAVAFARRHRIPVLTGFHTNFHAYSRHYGVGFLSRAIYGYLRRLHNRADGTLVPTAELREVLEADGFHNVHVWGRGVDAELFQPARRSESLRRDWGVGPEGRAVLYVGRLAAEKDLPLAIRAFRAMQEADPALRFVLVGDGPLHRRLQREHPDLLFCGARRGTGLAEHYASADLFLFASRTETYGNVVPEAMASGLAVVAFDYAAPRDLITSDRDGLLVPFGDEEAFIDAAVALAAVPERGARLGGAARERALQRDWPGLMSRLEVLLRGTRARQQGVAS